MENLIQSAVGRARVSGNCLPVARCVPHAALPRWGWGDNHLWAWVGARKNGFCCGRVASGSFGREGHLYGERVGGEAVVTEGFRGTSDFTKALP